MIVSAYITGFQHLHLEYNTKFSSSLAPQNYFYIKTNIEQYNTQNTKKNFCKLFAVSTCYLRLIFWEPCTCLPCTCLLVEFNFVIWWFDETSTVDGGGNLVWWQKRLNGLATKQRTHTVYKYVQWNCRWISKQCKFKENSWNSFLYHNLNIYYSIRVLYNGNRFHDGSISWLLHSLS